MAKSRKHEEDAPIEIYSARRKKLAGAESSAPAGPDLSHVHDGLLKPEVVALADLVLDPKNANKHGENSIEGIKSVLTTYGQREAITVNRKGNIVQKGNGRVEAARALGWTHIVAVFVDDDQEIHNGVSLTDNQVARLSRIDPEALKARLKEVNTRNDERLGKMLADLAKEKGLFKTEPKKKGVAFQAAAPALELILTFTREEDLVDVETRMTKEGWKCRRAA